MQIVLLQLGLCSFCTRSLGYSSLPLFDAMTPSCTDRFRNEECSRGNIFVFAKFFLRSLAVENTCSVCKDG